MPRKGTSIVVAMITLGLSLQGAQAGSATDLATVLANVDRGFVCPEFQPDDAARRAELLAFSRALAAVGPKRLSYKQAAYIRAKLLERHRCSNSRGNLASAPPMPPIAVDPPAVPIPTEAD